MANVFAKRPIVITRGKGALVWDINGKEYIDCTGSYGVALLGHSHPKMVAAVCKQAEKLIVSRGVLQRQANRVSGKTHQHHARKD